MRNRFLLIFLVLLINSAFSQNDSIKSLVKKTNELKLDMWDLTEYAMEHIKDEAELARFFYYWIGSNIEYDYVFYKKIIGPENIDKEYLEKQDEYKVYENRKGVCGGYANLFKWFMQEVGIEVEYISGHIRSERNHYVELESDDHFRHAWNAVKINGKWILVDTTWGTSLNAEVADFYFDIPPWRAIISHYPEKSRWQLLKKPISLTEFNNSMFVKPIWFKVGYSDIPKMKMDYKYYYLIFRDNPNKGWEVNLQYSIDNQNFHELRELITIKQGDYTILRFYKSIVPKKTYFKVNLFMEKIPFHSDVINFKT